MTNWRRLLRWSVCVVYVMLITWLSLAPASVFHRVSSPFPQADKVVHFLMYGVLVLLLRWALSYPSRGGRRSGMWVPLGALAYGALMEASQSLLVRADRYFEVWDLTANGVGAAVFWWLAGWWQARRLL